MSDAAGRTIELRYELDAPPGKVWRALAVPALRDRWLPSGDLAEAEAVDIAPEREVSYRMCDGLAGSTVTFHVEPGSAGCTCLRVVHRSTGARLPGSTDAANRNAPLMRAA